MPPKKRKKEKRKDKRREVMIEVAIHAALDKFIAKNELRSKQALIEGLIVRYLEDNGVSIDTPSNYLRNI